MGKCSLGLPSLNKKNIIIIIIIITTVYLKFVLKSFKSLLFGMK